MTFLDDRQNVPQRSRVVAAPIRIHPGFAYLANLLIRVLDLDDMLGPDGEVLQHLIRGKGRLHRGLDRLRKQELGPHVGWRVGVIVDVSQVVARGHGPDEADKKRRAGEFLSHHFLSLSHV